MKNQLTEDRYSSGNRWSSHGVRESLEAQTMNMAKATAALISEKLRHACGAGGVRDCRYLHRRHGRVGRL